jgi:hypothetical protein
VGLFVGLDARPLVPSRMMLRLGSRATDGKTLSTAQLWRLSVQPSACRENADCSLSATLILSRSWARLAGCCQLEAQAIATLGLMFCHASAAA